jgi:diguanylate cyclase (GGDEF)-like protein/PAS domain S-box-containing protein
MSTQAEANLSALIESSEDPIWSVDLEHRLLTFNRAFLRNCQNDLHFEPAIGMRPQDFPPSAHGDVWAALFGRAVIEGPFRTEYQASTGDVIEFTLSPIVVGGVAQGVSVFGKDITERKHAENALLAAEKKYRDIFDGAVEGMFQSSLVSSFRSVNMAYAKMLGFDSPEAAEQGIHAAPEKIWADPAERERFQSKLRRDGAVHGYECEFKRQDGSVLWVAISSRIVFDEKGVPILHQGFINDITARKHAEMRLRDSEERFRATFEQAAIGIMHVSFNGVILDSNPQFTAIVGYTQQELAGMAVKQITPAGYLGQSDEMLVILNSLNQHVHTWEKPYIHKDGRLTWVRLTASIQRDGNGNRLHFITFVEDINAQRAAEDALAAAARALKSSETRYRTVFQTILDAVAVRRTSDNVYIEANAAYLHMTGFDREELIGKTPDEIDIWTEGSDRQQMNALLETEHGFRDFELRLRRRNGNVFWGLVSASIIDLDGISCVLSVTRDISAAKAAEDKIRDLAFFDPLTRLPNRRLMLDRLQQALTTSTRNPRKLALLFVDLDNFKILNDTLGHQIGDLLLQEVAVRLIGSVRESDTVARLGGDEFIVMVDGLSGTPEDAAAQALTVAEKIFAALARPYAIDTREIHSHSSIGIAVFGTPHRNPNEILQQAEIAMYQAKSAGRNAIRFFSPALQAVVNARAAMEEDLRHAIKADQFVLYYQPQIDNTGLIGAEVLIRWQHPDRGLLLPGDFIPLAEETGLILGLGEWTLQKACAQVASWSKQSPSLNFSVAVNISARQFRQADFVAQVLAALERTGADPITIKLELTESMLVENIEDIIAKMTELRSHGLSFSLDDFGTGYSSLSYLKRLPLDQLKIDRAFVRDILSDVSSGAIAQTIISLSKAMGLSVIAEGVETEGQRDFLVGLGCTSFQGYLFSRPLPIEEFEKLWIFRASSAVPSSR